MFLQRLATSLNETGHGVLRSMEAEVLRGDVRTAFEGVQQAHSGYEHALAIASDADLDREGFLALHEQGRAYAATVMNYSNAVMALLSYMETARADAKSQVREAASQG